MSKIQKELKCTSNSNYNKNRNLIYSSSYSKFLSQIKQDIINTPISKQKAHLNSNSSLTKNNFETSSGTKFECRNKIKNFEKNLLLKGTVITNKNSNLNEDKILINDNKYDNMYENILINDELTNNKTNNIVNNKYYNPFIYSLKSSSNKKKFNHSNNNYIFDNMIIENTNFDIINPIYNMKEIQKELNSNFELSSTQNKKRSNSIKLINQLKKDLITYKNDIHTNDETDLIEYEDSNNNDEINKIEKNKIQNNTVINSSEDDGNNNSSESENETNNAEDLLGSTFEVVDLDKSSEYTLETGTNIDRLRKKNKFEKISSILLLLFLCFSGLFFLLIKRIYFKEKDKKLISVNSFTNIIKIFVDFFGSDFDIYKLLGVLIAVYVLCLIIRMFIKMMKNINNIFRFK